MGVGGVPCSNLCAFGLLLCFLSLLLWIEISFFYVFSAHDWEEERTILGPLGEGPEKLSLGGCEADLWCHQSEREREIQLSQAPWR